MGVSERSSASQEAGATGGHTLRGHAFAAYPWSGAQAWAEGKGKAAGARAAKRQSPKRTAAAVHAVLAHARTRACVDPTMILGGGSSYINCGCQCVAGKSTCVHALHA